VQNNLFKLRFFMYTVVELIKNYSCKSILRYWNNVATQVGCSGCRIDMAVRHPQYNGRFAIGVECDGAMYHSARTSSVDGLNFEVKCEDDTV
jgi:hypothetical protein